MIEDLPITLENCDVGFENDLDPNRSITVVPKTHDSVLSDRQLVDYKDQREQFLSWLLNVGKKPERAKGYSPYTVYSDAYRSARFDLWVCERRGKYHYPPDETDAQDYIDHLAYSEKGRVEKGKLQESIKHLNKWLQHTRGEQEWVFNIRFESSSNSLEARDYLSKDERRVIRQAALIGAEDARWLANVIELASEEEDWTQKPSELIAYLRDGAKLLEGDLSSKRFFLEHEYPT